MCITHSSYNNHCQHAAYESLMSLIKKKKKKKKTELQESVRIDQIHSIKYLNGFRSSILLVR